MVGPIAMLYNIGQVMISKREDKTKPWHSLKHKLVGDSLGLFSGPTKDGVFFIVIIGFHWFST